MIDCIRLCEFMFQPQSIANYFYCIVYVYRRIDVVQRPVSFDLRMAPVGVVWHDGIAMVAATSDMPS